MWLTQYKLQLGIMKKRKMKYSVNIVDVPLKEPGEAWRPVSPFKSFSLVFSFNLSVNNYVPVLETEKT